MSESRIENDRHSSDHRFISIGLLLYMALKTEPVAAIAMVVVITVTTWVQVIVYNHRLNREASQKEKEFGSN